MIDDIIKEGDEVLGEDNLLRDAWRQDVTERLEYERDQCKAACLADADSIKPSFLSPYTSKIVHFVICPMQPPGL